MKHLKSLIKWSFLALSLLLVEGVLPSCSSTLDPFQKACDGVDCSGHGECQIQGGKAVCVCDQGYHAEGLACVEDADPCEGIDCSGHGKCVVQGGEATCECEPGYHAEGLACVEDADPCDGIDCDDQNPCTDDSCSSASGCVHQDNSDPCDDGNACTVNNVCSSGVCTGVAPDCTGTGGDCREDYTCDPSGSLGNCDIPGAPKNEGMPCNDGNACTEDGTCSGGVCTDGTPVVEGTHCEDGLFCNGADTCDGAGACIHAGNPCGVIRCNELNDTCNDDVWYGLGGSDFGPWKERMEGSSWGAGISESTRLSFSPSLVLDDFGNPVVAWDSSDGGREIYIKRFDGSAWVEIGDGSASGGGISLINGDSRSPYLVLDADGNPVVAWCEGDYGNAEIYIKRFDGNSWVGFDGSASGGGIGSNASPYMQPSLALDSNGNPVVAWSDLSSGSEEIYVKRFDGTAWVEVGTGAASGGGISHTQGESQSPSLAVTSTGDLVVAWEDSSSGDGEIYVKRFNGTSWVEVGTGAASGGGISNLEGRSEEPSLVVDVEGNPVVAWTYHGDENYIYVKRFDGSAWVEVGEGSASGEGISGSPYFSGVPSLALDAAGNPVVAWSGSIGTQGQENIFVKRFNGSAWVEVGDGSSSGGGISHTEINSDHPSLAVDSDGDLTVAWSNRTHEGTEIYLKRFSGTEWMGVGDNLPVGGGISDSSLDSVAQDLVVDDSGNPVVAWDNSTGIYVKRFDDSAPGGAWVEVGAGSATGEGVGVGGSPILVRSSNGNLFLSDSALAVMKYNGENWLDFSDPETYGCIPNPLWHTSCNIHSLSTTMNGNLVLAGNGACADLSGCSIFVAKHDGSSWTPLEDIGFNAINSNPSLAIDSDGNPVVAWVGWWDGKLDIFVTKYESGMWMEVGSGSTSGGGISSAANTTDSPSLAIDGNGNLIIAWADNCLEWGGGYSPDKCQQIFIKKFDGNSWVEMGIGSASGGGINQTDGGCYPSLAIDSAGNPVVAWEDRSMGHPEIYVKGFDGNQWVEIGTGSASGGGVSNSATGSYSPSLGVGGGRICVAWSEMGLDSEQIVMRCADE